MIAREHLPLPAIAAEVAQGLRRSPKSLPPWLFYDQRGSALFEEITRLPEYYLTRTERCILETHGDEICRLAGSNLTVVELGAGTADKTRILLRRLLRRQLKLRYVPVDVSFAALESAEQRLRAELPELDVRPIVADYTMDALRPDDIAGRKLVLYLGSSIGNFEPEAAKKLLSHVRAGLRPGDCLLLGADRVKPESVLLPAYDDAQGVTEAFNKNMLARINRELGADFELANFRHIAEWNAPASRIEIYLESVCRQSVRIGFLQMSVDFQAGERLHTENSYKYTEDAVREMLAAAGFVLERTFSDPRQWFGVHLARVPGKG
ncbi:MAG TPA: L-histidine N(alpha)-methyltransferase [Terriglobales bacterium]|nr:L-histidine N(alpha)-methyltransferase [Terriglobales bacterium]